MPRVRAAVKPPGGPAPPVHSSDPAETSSMAAKRPPIRRAASDLPPTPPRTTHKRKRRSRSRVTDSSSEEEDEEEIPKPESDGEESQPKPGVVVIGHKKRKTLTLDAIAEELSEARAEEMFWMDDGNAKGGSSSTGSGTAQPQHKVVRYRAATHSRSRTRSPSSSPPPAPHLLRRGHTGLFSPPPSRRAPTVVPRPATPPPPEPPKEKEKEKGKEVPQRDSPNNPFLADDSSGSVTPSTDLYSPEPRTPKKRAEQPTLNYVYRGTKVVVANPYFISKEAEEELEARARLPLAHPDYSPPEAGTPKMLFPEARKRDFARRRAHPTVPMPTSPTPTTSRRRAGSASSDEGHKRPAAPTAPGPSTIVEADEEDVDAMAAAMAARVAKCIHKGVVEGDEPRTRPSSRVGELPELPQKDRSDALKRALGPARK